jgi:hypothetical protein
MKMMNDTLERMVDIVENVVLDREVDTPGVIRGYSDSCFRGSLKIFMHVLLEKMWAKQEADNMSFEDRCAAVESVGAELRELILKQTGIDTTKLYDEDVSIT